MKLRDRISVNKQYEIYKLLDWIDIKKLDWNTLSSNPNAIHLLEQNKKRIDWHYLSFNPNALHLLEQNQNKINWYCLSQNPNAIHLLEQNQDKINWTLVSSNPSIFKYNYKELKLRMKETIAEDLMKNRFHPKYINKWIEWGQVDAEDFT